MEGYIKQKFNLAQSATSEACRISKESSDTVSPGEPEQGTMQYEFYVRLGLVSTWTERQNERAIADFPLPAMPFKRVFHTPVLIQCMDSGIGNMFEFVQKV